MLRKFYFAPMLLAAVCLGSVGCRAESAATPVNGALYAVIDAAYDGAVSPVASFVRFFSGAAGTSSFAVLLIGSQTGKTYGHAVSLQIPQNAAVQYSLTQLLTLAGATDNAGAANGDTSYAVYIQDADATAGYQHVTYQMASHYFENASACANGLLPAATVANNANVVVTNAHTSLLAGGGFSSRLAFHNYSNAAVTPRVTIVDAGLLAADGSTIAANAGRVVGQTSLSIPANTTVFKSFTELEAAAGWTPSAGQAYANIIVSDPAGTAPPVLVTHTIHNAIVNGDINMTTACAVGKPPTGTATYKGTIAGPAGQSGTLAAKVQTASAATAAPAAAKIGFAGIKAAAAGTPASGMLILADGGTVPLNGTFDGSTNAVHLAGNGYAFNGSVKDGIYSGDYSGPNNSSGAFSTLSTAQGVVTAYCGTYDEPRPPGESFARAGGVFNLQIAANGAISGDTSSTYGQGYHYGIFTGHAEGSIAYVTHSSANGDPANTDDVIGTIKNGTISGTYDAAGGMGTFSGSVCQVPAS